MARLTLSLLGPFQAGIDSKSITDFATDKARALLAYLAVEADRPHRRDSLAALLWPDWDDAGARSNLRLALHRLRETLDAAAPNLSQGLFHVTRETIQLNTNAVELDVARFNRLLETSELHPHRLLHLCPSCLDQLEEAVALYTGELLSGLSIDSAPGFEQWELARREELTQRTLSALFRLAEAFEQLGDYRRGLALAQRQVTLDPYREEAHRQIIRLYALRGERAAALTHFKRMRQLLVDELGVEPDPATIELAESVRAGGQTGSNHRTGRPLLYHFPARFTPFYGREAEIARLVSRLQSADSRLITIVAPGGMGKTRLAIAASQAVAEQPGFPDGIFYVPLARTGSGDLLPSAMATALGLNLAGPTPPAEHMASFLGQKNLLLVLDNFEHLMGEVELIVRLLETAPDVRILTTSRRALAVRAEERFVLGGLDENAAHKLFAAAATRIRPDYDPAPDDEVIGAIVRDVGGMPLAIELAATWVRVMEPPEIATRIHADLDFLSTTMRDLPPRQRSMRAVFDNMWATLSSTERKTLAMLSVLRGPFRLNAAEAISGASPGVLARLLDYALLTSTGGGRFELHELLRQYAGEKLAAIKDPKTIALEKHSDHYLALAAYYGAALGGSTSKEALAGMQRNLDNIRAAWQWTVANGRLDAVAATTEPLATFYRFSGYLAEGAEAFATAAQALEAQIANGRVAPGAGYPIIYDLLGSEAMLLDTAGRIPAALERLAKVRAGREALGDRKGLCLVLSDMSQAYVRSANFIEANRTADAALELARNLDDSALLAHALHNKGSALAWSGDPAGGQALLEKSIAHHRAMKDQKELVGALCDLGMTCVFRHDIDIARGLFHQSLSLAERIGDNAGALLARTNLGALFLEVEELTTAEQYTLEALALAQDLGEQQLLPIAIGNLGHISLTNGNHAAALRHYIDTLAITRESGLDYMLSEALIGLAVMATEEEPAAAARWLAAVKGWRRDSGYGADTTFILRLMTRTEAELRAILGDAAYEARQAEEPAMSLEAAGGEATAWAEGDRI